MSMSIAARRIRPKGGLPRESWPVPPFPVLQFSVEQYESMIEEGILKQPERLELINGWITPRMTHNPRHDSSVYRLQRRLVKLLGDEWVVRTQSSIRATMSLPEPDIVVACGPEDRYDTERPTSKAIELLVEVSDSTLAQDQGIKKELYAKDRIKAYWIVNLVERQIEVYTLPRSGKRPSYRQRQVFLPADRIPVVIAGETIGVLAVAELLA